MMVLQTRGIGTELNYKLETRPFLSDIYKMKWFIREVLQFLIIYGDNK